MGHRFVEAVSQPQFPALSEGFPNPFVSESRRTRKIPSSNTISNIPHLIPFLIYNVSFLSHKLSED